MSADWGQESARHGMKRCCGKGHLSRPNPRINVNLGLERESHLNYNLTNIIKSVT